MKLLALLSVAVFPLATIIVSHANDIEPGKEFYTAIKAPRPIVLDGDLSEWSGANVLADPRFSIPKGSGDNGTLVNFEVHNGGDWTGPDDHTSAVRVVYDEENVYFGFVVTDEYHENSANSAWNGDSVQLMIANETRDAQVALYNYALGGVEGALGDVIVMHEAGPGGTEAVVTRNGTTKRTIYEIKLPKASLALDELTGGVQFGLGMAINDGDELTPGQRGWGGLGAHSIVFGKSPGETALVTLATPPPSTGSNDIEFGKEYYTAIKASNPVVLDGDLSEWAGAAPLADPRFAIPKGSGNNGTLVNFELHNGGDWTGPDDHTSAVRVVYDDDNVYFGFVVTDEYHENSANSAWNGDSVQLMIANETRDAQVALYNYALGGVEGALGDVIVMHEAGPGGTEAVVKRDGVTKRTIYEIKLPKESLALPALTGGVQFGLGMAINDGDEATPGQRGWGGLGAHALVFGKSPQQTALVTLATANDIEPGKEFHSAKRPPSGAIVLDGKLFDWSGVPVLSDPRFAVPKNSGSRGGGALTLFEVHNGGTWNGPDDQTSAVQVAYDSDNVYFAFTVTDDYHENSANSAWNGDSVQLMIANDKQDTQIALYNYALGGVEGALGDVIVMHEAGPGGTEAVVTRDGAAKRTIYEIRLPKESMGLDELESGVQFGLGMAINDGDESTPGQRGWGGLGAHALVFGKSPQQTALITLDGFVPPASPCFLSAIATTRDSLSFRANDFDDCEVDPDLTTLTIDGEEVELMVGEKQAGATDFAYIFPEPFPTGSAHSFKIEVRDTNGLIVAREEGTWTAPIFGILTPDMMVTRFDRGRPGFMMRVFQNDIYQHTSLAQTELALRGELVDGNGTPVTENYADPTLVGPALGEGVILPPVGHLETGLVEFEIPSVINLSVNADIGGPFGNFAPDDQMPGIPGTFATTEGCDAEILALVEFPAAGYYTMGVNSDDAFRMEGGPFDDPARRAILGQFDGGRGAADSVFEFEVEEAGVYPIRVIWNNGGGDANIEIFSVLEDETRVLLNDTAAGGLGSFSPGGTPTPQLQITEMVLDRVTGDILLVWNSKPGKTYALEAKSTLRDPAWLELDDGIQSAGTTTSRIVPAAIIAPLDTSSQIYLRIREE